MNILLIGPGKDVGTPLANNLAMMVDEESLVMNQIDAASTFRKGSNGLSQNIRTFRLDVTGEYNRWRTIFERGEYGAVIFCPMRYPHQDNPEAIEASKKVHGSIRDIFKIAADSGVRRFGNTSTLSVYYKPGHSDKVFTSDNPLTEDVIPNPGITKEELMKVYAYAPIKLDEENSAIEICREFDARLLVARLCGPREDRVYEKDSGPNNGYMTRMSEVARAFNIALTSEDLNIDRELKSNPIVNVCKNIPQRPCDRMERLFGFRCRDD